MVAMRPPTGHQFELSFHDGARDHRARVAQVAGALQEYTIDGAHLVEPGALERPAQKGQSIVMAPWPGRVARGVWDDEGVTRQLAITEPAMGNASHGLLRYTLFQPVVQEPHRVVLAATIVPQTGWPYLIDTTVEYRLGPDGLTVTHTATNVGERTAPWALGAHPYLRVGDRSWDDVTLTLPAATAFETNETMIPVREVPVDVAEGTDLRRGARVSQLALDTGFGVVTRDEDGLAISSLHAADGALVELWQDESFGYLVVFTPTDFPRAEGLGRAVAIEPMSAPANALNTGEGLVRLAPGDKWQGRWGIRGNGA